MFYFLLALHLTVHLSSLFLYLITLYAHFVNLHHFLNRSPIDFIQTDYFKVNIHL